MTGFVLDEFFQKKDIFNNVLPCLCELSAAFWCCAAEFQKKDIFQQSTFIRRLIDTILGD